MRKKLVAGNWKMNLEKAEAFALVNYLLENESRMPGDVGVLIAPPALYLSELHEAMKNSGIHLGAQNAHFEDSGAFTGEVSPAMLRAAGISHVILGHSERRQYFGETDELVSRKTASALRNHLQPIVCVGEKQQQRLDKTHMEVVEKQLRGSLSNASARDMATVTLAYEPVWAIGTGLTATSEQAGEMHRHIRNVVAGMYDASVADGLTIVYGGSCKPGNAAELFAMPDVDGGLIGGASLIAEDFLQIIDAADQ